MTPLLLKLLGLLGVLAAAYLWSRRALADRRPIVGVLPPSAEVPAGVILRGVRG